MFNDGEQFAFKEMQEFSTADGFVEVSECLAEMIKYVANEPSVGLFYIQKHTRNAAPNLINLKNNVTERSREMTLHTEDSEDSISIIRSMRECGCPIADEMIKDIKNSLAIMSAKHPKRGLINSSDSAFRLGRTRSWGPVAWGRKSSSPQQDGDKGASYLSNVLKSAKLKASNLKWPQVESSEESREIKDEKSISYLDPSLSDRGASISSGMPEAEAVELPLSSEIAEEPQEVPVDRSGCDDDLISLAVKYEEFKADREAKLEEWLGEMKN
ncbi:uncharacterized protein [Coffea arabica]|uniref:Uncharacterized protein LOC113730775 isoform X1 n=2 Tax=Coffea arabica TaxID=13443 RepID=A0A6P6W7T6_COFAR|nr:uncharacterized protein LOC113730775 isoform X1 [Coffea arabica]XP_027111483.1 uncharacterized protein LOC113730775 isoform X1 [Coffea arabica]XP_027111484.1 uncharacterized protein LOC113730775 isoform X1 [Coffea arabica]